jgi:hypothetical protein
MAMLRVRVKARVRARVRGGFHLLPPDSSDSPPTTASLSLRASYTSLLTWESSFARFSIFI